MNAILLAAGYGSRLQPLTKNTPKCLIKIHEKPLLEIWLDLLFNGNIEKVLINTHYLSDKVKKYIIDSKYSKKIIITEEKNLLGTGGTIIKNKDFIGEKSVLVAHADNLTTFDVNDFIKFHMKRRKYIKISMMTFITDQPENSGIILKNDLNEVIDFFEKVQNPPGNIANGAVYIFEPEVIEFMSQLNKKIIDISTEVIPHFLGKIQVYMNEIYHRDIGTVESLEKALNEYPKK